MSVVISVLLALAAFLISWIVASIPVWLSAKIFSRSATLGRAMIATFVGLFVFFILVAITSPVLATFSLVIGFIGVLLVFKSIFNVGWGGALGIAFIAALIAFILTFVLGLAGLFIHPTLIHRL